MCQNKWRATCLDMNMCYQTKQFVKRTEVICSLRETLRIDTPWERSRFVMIQVFSLKVRRKSAWRINFPAPLSAPRLWFQGCPMASSRVWSFSMGIRRGIFWSFLRPNNSINRMMTGGNINSRGISCRYGPLAPSPMSHLVISRPDPTNNNYSCPFTMGNARSASERTSAENLKGL